ncbi:DUF4309 domain-containing protein [Sporomusa sp. KB1]|jgi:hypothetical protein|uniref:DUF4309 domain-containing protein n=1 Tax=Sporomusa sp. KB1 TaxID=943346 RepID=UPI00119E690A|nr:DUF4309 domain-containing protein [Sporomusa sp. KB1]TWH51996.1 uncharacterized protein DUF4309 [Sporomusa sp. KB1]
MVQGKIYIIAIAVIVMSLVLGSTCFARLSDDDLMIDGISLGSLIQDVVDKYGEPTTKKDFTWNNGNFCLYDYHGIYQVTFLKSSGSIWFIESQATHLATSAGVTVGMTEKSLMEAYGKPDSKRYSNGSQVYVYENDLVIKELNFVLDNKGYN